jgi:Hemingway/CFA97
MRGSQFEDMHVTMAVAKQKEFELHKKKLKNIKPNIKADESLNHYQELN